MSLRNRCLLPYITRSRACLKMFLYKISKFLRKSGLNGIVDRGGFVRSNLHAVWLGQSVLFHIQLLIASFIWHKYELCNKWYELIGCDRDCIMYLEHLLGSSYDFCICRDYLVVVLIKHHAQKFQKLSL